MILENYCGIYGKGYEDKHGNLYLEKDGFLVERQKNKDNTYNFMISDLEFHEGLGFCYEENISLNEWRKFFIENFKEGNLEDIFYELMNDFLYFGEMTSPDYDEFDIPYHSTDKRQLSLF